MKIAIVHDYLDEFGGAERVLLALSEIWPDAPIYTSFYRPGSPAWERFKNKRVIVSFVHYIPFFAGKLHSPLRFLAPAIWNSFDLREFDVIIGSASWYITKGFKGRKPSSKEICYCHTPPRWLYGYQTSVEWQKYWPVRIYAAVVGHLMRLYDYHAAQRVDYFVANSKNIAGRIQKYYRRDSKIIYPPVDILPWAEVKKLRTQLRASSAYQPYYLVISRIVGGKGLELVVKTAIKMGLNLKIAGRPAGYSSEYKKIVSMVESSNNSKAKIELLGYVSDQELVKLYAGAQGFLALASDEDFGITPVEAMGTGTPVIAYRGGGYLETVQENKTGVFVDELSEVGLAKAIKNFEKMLASFDSEQIHAWSQQFSKARFQKEIKALVQSLA